jgi:hypothetical protein
MDFNKKLGGLTPKVFEDWFKRHNFKGDWKTHYKNVGGKLPKNKSNVGNTGTKSKDESGQQGDFTNKSS